MSRYFRSVSSALILLTALVILLTACGPNEAVDCARQCPGPKNNNKAAQTQERKADGSAALSFESLPTAERERLIAQWRSEFRENLRDELRTELADDSVPSINGKAERSPNAHSETENAGSQHLQVRSLPPTQDIEKDERGIKVLRHVCSTQINRRQPFDERDVFSVSDGSVFCYIEMAQVLETERSITIKFTHSTGLSQSFDLTIGQSPAWRTWSKLNLTKSMTGAWNCEVFNEAGTLLASKNFVITDEVFEQEPG